MRAASFWNDTFRNTTPKMTSSTPVFLQILLKSCLFLAIVVLWNCLFTIPWDDVYCKLLILLLMAVLVDVCCKPHCVYIQSFFVMHVNQLVSYLLVLYINIDIICCVTVIVLDCCNMYIYIHMWEPELHLELAKFIMWHLKIISLQTKLWGKFLFNYNYGTLWFFTIFSTHFPLVLKASLVASHGNWLRNDIAHQEICPFSLVNFPITVLNGYSMLQAWRDIFCCNTMSAIVLYFVRYCLASVFV